MAKISSSELILIRHGASDQPGRLCGRTDAGLAEVPGLPSGSRLAKLQAIWTSPARRCRETAAGLWPGRAVHEDVRLWEQDFGAWDGLAHGELPDLGELSREELADLSGPGGESFSEVCGRVAPALREIGGEGEAAVVVGHAGVIRAALALATGNVPGALAFEVDHLSVTRLRRLGDAYSVIAVNEVLA